MDTWSDLVKAIQSGQPPIYTLSKTDTKGCKAKLPTADFYDFNTKCKLINLAPFFTGLWNHEGYGTAGQNNGHQYQLEAAASDPQGDVHSRIERIYGKNMLVDVFVSNEVLSTNIFLNGKWSPEPARTNWCGIDWQWDPTVSLFKQISECY
jgi:hypothetical protein